MMDSCNHIDTHYNHKLVEDYMYDKDFDDMSFGGKNCGDKEDDHVWAELIWATRICQRRCGQGTLW